MKKYVLSLIGGLIVLVVGAGLQWPDGKLHVVACDVGQGDGILIWQGFNQVVVDGGPDDKIIGCLSKYMPFWDREVEMVVMTNGDADHMTGLIDVSKRYKVDQMIANNLVNETERFKALRQVVAERQIRVHAPKAGEEIKVGALRFEVLWPKERLGDAVVWTNGVDDRILGANNYNKTQANDQSVVLRLIEGKFSALLTGDISSNSEGVLIDSGEDLRSNVIKVGHHGSKYSSSVEFLAAVKPQAAVISVGKRNRYGHPTQEALGRLEEMGAKVLRTDELGDVELVSDGEKMWVK